MKRLTSHPRLVEQVHQAILSEITEGKLQPGERVIQEEIADALGVSRQPVQQALVLLRNQGLVADAPGRGLVVAPLDLTRVRNIYDVRAVLEGLAFRRAAELHGERAARLGPKLIENGREAVLGGSVLEMIAADLAFHSFVYELADNTLIALTLGAQWSYTQRAMGEVLMRDTAPRDIWDQHQAMLEAVASGRPDDAERLAREHITQAAEVMIRRLRNVLRAPHASLPPAPLPWMSPMEHRPLRRIDSDPPE